MNKQNIVMVVLGVNIAVLFAIIIFILMLADDVGGLGQDIDKQQTRIELLERYAGA